MSKHSPGANCEEDVHEGILNDLKEFVSGDVLSGINNLEVDIPSFTVVPRRTKIGRCTINYISGFIVKKC